MKGTNGCVSGVLGALLLLVAGCSGPANEDTSTRAPHNTPPSVTASTSPVLPPVEAGEQLPGRFHPQAVAFFDAETGLIAGSIRCPGQCSSPKQGLIARTTDGGHSWRVVRLTNTSVTHLTVVRGTREAWATASQCHYSPVACGRALLHSRDGGETWRKTQTTLLNPEFPTPERGWASTGQARDLGKYAPWATTTDGGETWRLERGPCGGYTNMLVDASFLTPTHGWVFCAASEPGAGAFQFKSVLHTVDGGRTWEPRAELTLEKSDVGGGGLAANGMGVGMQFVSPTRGWLWTGGGYSQLAQTTDGGHTWRTIEDGDGGVGETVSMLWLDELRGYWLRWTSGSGSSLRYTEDGGKTWDCRSSGPVAREADASDRVLFEHWRNRTWDLAVADPSTGQVSHLTDTKKLENGAVFSPDGSLVAFDSYGPENGDLFVMNPDGAGRRRLTGGETLDMFPAWSPNGTKIAYSALRLGMAKVHGEGIWVVDVATGARRRLTYGGNDQGAQWSPDGSRILFYGLRRGDQELMVVEASGGPVERVTHNRLDDLFPRWDADGTSIVFTRTVGVDKDTNTYRRHLFRLDLSTGREMRLTPRATSDEAGIISPDGTMIAFIRSSGTTGDLWVMNSDGSDERQLFGGGSDGGPPVWSPDGTRLAFSHFVRGGGQDLYVVDVRSGEVSVLTTLRGDEAVTDWGG